MILRRQPHATAKMIAEMTQLSSRQVERILAKLKKDGVLIRRGSRTNGWWEISE